jgi:hypothetical protein
MLTRERWFYAQGGQRRGPVPFNYLVETLLAQPDPLTVIVWRRGFAAWTRAQDLPDVEHRLTSFLNRRAVHAAASGPAVLAVEAAWPSSVPEIRAQAVGSPRLVYGAVAAGAGLLVVLGWLFWPRSQPSTLIVLPEPGPVASEPPIEPRPRAREGLPALQPNPTPTLSPITDRESDLPAAEVRQLRGVAAWSDDTLRLTVVNATAWRVTEIEVSVSRLVGDDLVEDPRRIVMLPLGESVEPRVAELLGRVAPGRKRPGVNPLDTGTFEAKVGPRPESFRFDLRAARGYAPSR